MKATLDLQTGDQFMVGVYNPDNGEFAELQQATVRELHARGHASILLGSFDRTLNDKLPDRYVAVLVLKVGSSATIEAFTKLMQGGNWAIGLDGGKYLPVINWSARLVDGYMRPQDKDKGRAAYLSRANRVAMAFDMWTETGKLPDWWETNKLKIIGGLN